MAVLLTEVKDYLWITWTNDDVRLQAILDWLNEDITNKVWDITLWDKTMTIQNKTSKSNFAFNSVIRDSKITLDIINPTAIKTINWNDFTSKVIWTDYIINPDWTAYVKNLSLYTINNFGFFDVVFTAGYSTTPKQLIAITSEYLGYLFSKDLWKDIIEEKMWPRWVKYAQGSEKEVKKTFYKWLNQFIPLSLRVW